MLKLSHRGLYGIKALYELAVNYEGKPVPTREISERHGLPVPFLEQVLHKLKCAGLIRSRRGVNGGYVLSRPPEEVTLGDAVRALEGPIALCECLSVEGDDNAGTQKVLQCVTSNIYRKLGKKVEDAFDSITFRELADEDIADIHSGVC